MKLRQEAVERLACVDAVNVVVACDALVARLQRIHQAAEADVRPPQEQIVGAHAENVEALLNLISVLRLDGTQPAAVVRLSRRLDGFLSGASRRGLAANPA